ncbi:MAG TPA: TlpA disulfide reductase family protein [Acidimicrobiia bacterium]
MNKRAAPRRSRAGASKRPAPRRSRAGVLATVGVAALVVVIVALLWTKDDGQPAAGAEQVSFTYFDGSQGSLAELVGTPVVLNFWASWCPACVAEMPALAEVERQFADRVAFIGMNMQEDDLAAAEALAARAGVGYPLAHDRDGAIFLGFGGVAMPTTVLIAADGSVARVHAGALFADDLAALIESELLG